MGKEKKTGNEEKAMALEAVRLQMEKQFGKGSIMKLGDKAANAGVQVIPTGALTLDAALGIGGYPKGRIIEIYGPESSGKTTLAREHRYGRLPRHGRADARLYPHRQGDLPHLRRQRRRHGLILGR